MENFSSLCRDTVVPLKIERSELTLATKNREAQRFNDCPSISSLLPFRALMTEPHIFDKAGALDRLDGDEEFLRELIGVFKESHRLNIDGLDSGLKDGKIGDVEREAHSLKSALGNLGAARASRCAQQLEQRARSGSGDGLAPLVENLIKEIQTFLSHLADIGWG